MNGDFTNNSSDGVISLKVYAQSPDPLFLDGKYSNSFVYELQRQITAEISHAMAVEGLAQSSIELELVFAPGTYMEHTSENVTYRRLLLSDKSCHPRDFWVKWTRLDGAVAYTVSDDVTADSIKFELGEDVPQKIREKEYRFLCGSNPDKYQSAMGKKTVTEWREVIKRAVRRGELTKIVSDLEVREHADEVNNKLLEILGSYGMSAPVAEEPEEPASSFDSVMEMARAALAKEEAFDGEEEYVPEQPSAISDGTEGDGEFLFGVETEEMNYSEESEQTRLDEDEFIEKSTLDEEEYIEEIHEEEVLDEENLEEEALDENVEEPVTQEPETKESEVEEQEPAQEDYAAAAIKIAEERARLEAEEEVRRLREERIRAEVEAKIRLEYESMARVKAEEEAEKLRLEHERLRRENERLAEAARIAEEERERRERALREENERRDREEEELRARIEAQMRQEVRERERLAEAARIAVEEQRRIEAEKAEREEAERQRVLNEEAERLAREEETRRAEERRREIERIRYEEEARRAAATPAPTPAPVPREEYITKHAKLMFRRNVDLNVIKRIKEIVEETLIANNKENIHIHIKAYPVDSTTINLDILKVPTSEGDLLVKMMKALGNGNIGITKITLE